MKKKFITKSAKQTQNIAKTLSSGLRGGEIISLIGDLGGGKTTFAQGLAWGLGIKEKVNSPTFVISKRYQVNHETIKYLYHFDLYRITDPQELLDIGFEEIISDEGNVVIIEWAEKAENLIPKDRNIKINFKYKNNNSREIMFGPRP